jgi:hypothetical protein
LRAAGAAEIVISVPELEAPFDQILAAGADGIAVPLKALTARQWEQLAGAVESEKRLWLGALDVTRTSLPRVADCVETVWRPWRQLGLPAAALSTLRVTPSAGLAGRSPAEATAVLGRITQLADGLNQLGQG